MGPKILVVDDDALTRDLIKKFLAAQGFSVVVTDGGSEALLLVKESKPDLVLLDIEMPGLDGFAVCRILKKEGASSVPVIMMSGKMIEEEDFVKGFEDGADDYVEKPLSMKVLIARIHAVLRRYRTAGESSPKLKKGRLELDAAGRTVTVAGAPVALTRKEFDLLAALIGRPDQVSSVGYLLETVWGYDPADYNDPSTVEVHISRLKKKLGPALAKRVVNVLGHGYKFVD